MFLQIPDYRILTFDFGQFADHVLDRSPVYETRSLLRLGMQARDAIAAAVDGVAEIPDDAAKLFQKACDAAPIPRLFVYAPDGSQKGSDPVPSRAFDPFYLATENMTTVRPERTPVPVAAE